MAKKSETISEMTKTKNVSTEIPPLARTGNKKARLIEMLHQNGGTTAAAISAALGWQPHTTRAAITGLRKSGHEVETAKPEDGGYVPFSNPGKTRHNFSVESRVDC